MVERDPHQRHPKPSRHNGRNQNVHVFRAEFPVGPIQGQKLWTRKVEQVHDQYCDHIAIKADMLEEPLHTAIVGRV